MFEMDLTFMTELTSILDRLDQLKLRLDNARPLPSSALSKIKESLFLEWTYNSNSIEGNSLTLRETQMVISEGFTVGSKSLREHFEVHNHQLAIDLVLDIAKRKANLKSYEILDIHSLVLRSIEDHNAGRLRNGAVRIAGANFIPPSARKVDGLLDELVDFVNDNPLDLHPIVLASIFHHRFVWIHPFFDGNGRTVRLVMNLLLMRQGYPPAIILKNDRKKYYAALDKANKGDYSKITLMMLQAVERSLNIYLSVLPADEDDEYVSLATIAEDPAVPYGQEYISLLARRGKINAHKEGRNWVSTKRAVLSYAQ